jgi:hypothetical protein
MELINQYSEYLSKDLRLGLRVRGSIHGTGATDNQKAKQKKSRSRHCLGLTAVYFFKQTPVERRHGDAAGPPPNGQASHRTDQLTSLADQPDLSFSRTHESEEEKKECADHTLPSSARLLVLAFPARSNDLFSLPRISVSFTPSTTGPP